MHDLTHPLGDETPVYPGDPPVRLRPHATHGADGYRVTDLRLGTHAGTHVDAPAHTEPDGATVDDLPPDRFAFDARLVDLRPLGDREAVGVDDLAAAEVAPDRDLLVLRTGWAAHWGTDRYAAHPFLTPAAATWCAERGLDVGLDAPSPDPRGSEDLPAHRALLGAGRVLVENLAVLEGLPRRFRLHAYPLPLAGADGSPVRAIAEPSDADR
ncbi:MAG: cyclase family protein [Haloferacaceae archaeon]